MISNRGMRHLALRVNDVARAVEFYGRVFGMRLVWQPDPDNAYLSSGCDNLALHRGTPGDASAGALDHFGFVVQSVADLEAGWRWAEGERLDIVHPLRRHRDGSVSFYIRDPDGNVIQLLFEPNISPLEIGSPKG
jgi:catechol 2,3-dioxygenase-like lactoylglutathione lyase family enzyme